MLYSESVCQKHKIFIVCEGQVVIKTLSGLSISITPMREPKVYKIFSNQFNSCFVKFLFVASHNRMESVGVRISKEDLTLHRNGRVFR